MNEWIPEFQVECVWVLESDLGLKPHHLGLCDLVSLSLSFVVCDSWVIMVASLIALMRETHKIMHTKHQAPRAINANDCYYW